jgi:hypothetical protein
MDSTSRMREGLLKEDAQILSSKTAASEEARLTLRYVESLSDARTPLAYFFQRSPRIMAVAA